MSACYQIFTSAFYVFKFALLQLKMNVILISCIGAFIGVFCVAMGFYALRWCWGLILSFMELVRCSMIWAFPDVSRRTLNRCYIYVNFAYKAFKDSIKGFKLYRRIKYRVKGLKGFKRRIKSRIGFIVLIGLYIWSVWCMIWQAIKKACDGVFLSLCDIINILIMRFKARNAHLKPFKCVRRTRHRL